MSEISPIKQIDLVLTFLNDNFSNKPNINTIRQKFSDLDSYEIDQILNKLLKDGYVIYDNDGRQIDFINSEYIKVLITFEGKLFHQQGGYNQKLINDSYESNRLERIEKVQLVLTIILAVSAFVAAVYYLVDLYWRYGWFRFCS